MDKEKINAAWASWKSENVKNLNTQHEEDAIDEQLLYTDIGKEIAMKIAAAPVVTGIPIHFALFWGCHNCHSVRGIPWQAPA